jgi:hypothetical protein
MYMSGDNESFKTFYHTNLMKDSTMITPCVPVPHDSKVEVPAHPENAVVERRVFQFITTNDLNNFSIGASCRSE